MKEFIDKLIRRFEEAKVSANRRNSFDSEVSYACAIEIVNQLAEEYKGKSVKGDLISRSHVIKELNEIYLDNPWDSKEDILEKAIGIVEYINCSTDTSTNISTKVSEMSTGWIPCSERLPEADHYVLCQGNNSMFVACVDSFDGEWRDNHFYKRTNVKAWCELPAPYTEGE